MNVIAAISKSLRRLLGERKPKTKWDAWRFAPGDDLSARELAAVMMTTSSGFGGYIISEHILFPEGKSPEDMMGMAGINRHFLRDPEQDSWEEFAPPSERQVAP